MLIGRENDPCAFLGSSVATNKSSGAENDVRRASVPLLNLPLVDVASDDLDNRLSGDHFKILR